MQKPIMSFGLLTNGRLLPLPIALLAKPATDFVSGSVSVSHDHPGSG